MIGQFTFNSSIQDMNVAQTQGIEEALHSINMSDQTLSNETAQTQGFEEALNSINISDQTLSDETGVQRVDGAEFTETYKYHYNLIYNGCDKTSKQSQDSLFSVEFAKRIYSRMADKGLVGYFPEKNLHEGQFLMDELSNVLKSSVCTIFLVTKECCQNGWLKYAQQFAVMNNVDCGDSPGKALIPIILGGPIPDELRAYVSLVWDEERVEHMWNRLETAIWSAIKKTEAQGKVRADPNVLSMNFKATNRPVEVSRSSVTHDALDKVNANIQAMEERLTECILKIKDQKDNDNFGNDRPHQKEGSKQTMGEIKNTMGDLFFTDACVDSLFTEEALDESVQTDDQGLILEPTKLHSKIDQTPDANLDTHAKGTSPMYTAVSSIPPNGQYAHMSITPNQQVTAPVQINQRSATHSWFLKTGDSTEEEKALNDPKFHEFLNSYSLKVEARRGCIHLILCFDTIEEFNRFHKDIDNGKIEAQIKSILKKETITVNITLDETNVSELKKYLQVKEKEGPNVEVYYMYCRHKPGWYWTPQEGDQKVWMSVDCEWVPDGPLIGRRPIERSLNHIRKLRLNNPTPPNLPVEDQPCLICDMKEHKEYQIFKSCKKDERRDFIMIHQLELPSPGRISHKDTFNIPSLRKLCECQLWVKGLMHEDGKPKNDKDSLQKTMMTRKAALSSSASSFQPSFYLPPTLEPSYTDQRQKAFVQGNFTSGLNATMPRRQVDLDGKLEDLVSYLRKYILMDDDPKAKVNLDGKLADLVSYLRKYILMYDELNATTQLEKKRVSLDIGTNTDNDDGMLDGDIDVKIFIEDKDTSAGFIKEKVHLSMTIKQLKIKMLQKYSFPPEIQKWIIGKQIPKDNEKLSKYGVEEDSSLYLYLASAHSVGLNTDTFFHKFGNLLSQGSIPETFQQAIPEEQAFNIDPNDLPTPPPGLTQTQKSPGGTPNQVQLQKQRQRQSKAVGSFDGIKTKYREPTDIPPVSSLTGSESATHERQVGWTCPKCIYMNMPTRPVCEICAETRPQNYVMPDTLAIPGQEGQGQQEEANLETLAVDAPGAEGGASDEAAAIPKRQIELTEAELDRLLKLNDLFYRMRDDTDDIAEGGDLHHQSLREDRGPLLVDRYDGGLNLDLDEIKPVAYERDNDESNI